MRLSEFKTRLLEHPSHALVFVLPDGGIVPAHAHITEAGRVDKSFMDCGGTIRRVSACTLQAWVADDTDHRIQPRKLSDVLDLAAPLFLGDDLEVEVEYEDGIISQFPVLEARATDAALLFQLGSKHTDCLAKDVCLPQNAAAAETCGTGCCC